MTPAEEFDCVLDIAAKLYYAQPSPLKVCNVCMPLCKRRFNDKPALRLSLNTGRYKGWAAIVYEEYDNYSIHLCDVHNNYIKVADKVKYSDIVTALCDSIKNAINLITIQE